MTQCLLFSDTPHIYVRPFRTQLLKWVGNKQRFAHEIVGLFLKSFNRYFELFLGSGGVLATLAPKNASASDAYPPLMDIWFTLKNDPDRLKHTEFRLLDYQEAMHQAKSRDFIYCDPPYNHSQ